MNYNYLVKNVSLSREKLLQYGFTPSQNGAELSYRCDLYNGLYVEVRLADKQLDVEVFDGLFKQKYAPFASGHGGAAVRVQVREILEDILARCAC